MLAWHDIGIGPNGVERLGDRRREPAAGGTSEQRPARQDGLTWLVAPELRDLRQPETLANEASRGRGRYLLVDVGDVTPRCETEIGCT